MEERPMAGDPDILRLREETAGCEQTAFFNNAGAKRSSTRIDMEQRGLDELVRLPCITTTLRLSWNAFAKCCAR
jgi:hypothetical protein